MGTARLRKVKSTEDLEERIDDFMTQEYEVVEQGERTALLRKKGFGSTGIHVVLLLCTWGIGNLIYASIAKYNAEKVFLKVVEDK